MFYDLYIFSNYSNSEFVVSIEHLQALTGLLDIPMGWLGTNDNLVNFYIIIKR